MRTSVAALTFLTLTLTGCAVAPTAAPTVVQGAAIQGKVHGGQQPISGAHVYLLAANTTGYGGAGIAPTTLNASVSLLNPADPGVYSDSVGAYVLTSSTGGFSITGDYACTPGQQVYLYGLGGNPGAGINSASGLMAILGSCPTAGNFLAATPYVSINEISTIAAAYAFAGFATDATHVSSSGTAVAQSGIANAFLNAGNLANISTGAALATTPAGNGTVPQNEILTLANILATCVNSNDATSGTTPTFSANCSTLFGYTLSGGTIGTTPTDTASAAINIAHNPGANVDALFALPTPTAPFAVSGTYTQPNDWTIGIIFFGSGLYAPWSIAIDGSGNAWIADPGGPSGSNVSEFSSTGTAISPSNGYTGGGLDDPLSIAIDASGNAWVVNGSYSVGCIPPNPATCKTVYDNSLSKFSSTGTAISPSTGYTGGGLNAPYSIAIDGSGNTWIANIDGASVSKFSTTGTALSSSSGYTGAGLDSPKSIAIDSSGNAWIANDNGNNVSNFSSTGTAISPSTGYTGGGLEFPYAIAIDGSGNAWIANFYGDGTYYGNSVSNFSSTGTAISPPTGYTGGGLSNPSSIAIDGSGNAWIADYYNSRVSEIIGVAAPVITPICAGLPATPTADGSSLLGTRP